MGTIYDQPPRHRYDDVSIADAIDILENTARSTPGFVWTATDAVALFAALVEQAKLSAYIANGDAFDEQMTGLAELGQSFVTIIGGNTK